MGVEAKPRIRGATDVTCGPTSVTFTVRTQKPMTGLMYAQQYHDDPKCVKVETCIILILFNLNFFLLCENTMKKIGFI